VDRGGNPDRVVHLLLPDPPDLVDRCQKVVALNRRG
jgi:hypothetical protein